MSATFIEIGSVSLFSRRPPCCRFSKSCRSALSGSGRELVEREGRQKTGRESFLAPTFRGVWHPECFRHFLSISHPVPHSKLLIEH